MGYLNSKNYIIWTVIITIIKLKNKTTWSTIQLYYIKKLVLKILKKILPAKYLKKLTLTLDVKN